VVTIFLGTILVEATPLRIVVVDDSPLYRRTVCNMLEKQPNLQVVAEAEDGLEAIQAVEKHRPDVVLMDISMPVLNGIDATWIIKSKYPNVRVVILSMHDAESISDAACKAGACRCLGKGCSPKEIIQAIMTAGIRSMIFLFPVFWQFIYEVF
jgi:two-component system, NarL family, nitrate/nitrite response regulator NarL